MTTKELTQPEKLTHAEGQLLRAAKELLRCGEAYAWYRYLVEVTTATTTAYFEGETQRTAALLRV